MHNNNPNDPLIVDFVYSCACLINKVFSKTVNSIDKKFTENYLKKKNYKYQVSDNYDENFTR